MEVVHRFPAPDSRGTGSWVPRILYCPFKKVYMGFYVDAGGVYVVLAGLGLG